MGTGQKCASPRPQYFFTGCMEQVNWGYRLERTEANRTGCYESRAAAAPLIIVSRRLALGERRMCLKERALSAADVRIFIYQAI
jgi:hypothetical protein